jgi:gamma-glutamyltranspeptidase/glutathione hydrolase
LCVSRLACAEAGVAATSHHLATEAALDAMKQGGNAVDAAVAAMLTLGVVEGYNSGIGGGCFMLIRTAAGELICIDGRETAPAAATRDMYVRNGVAETSLSQTGALASATPGAVAAYELAVRSYGKRPLGDQLTAAAALAERGFPVGAGLARALQQQAPTLARNPSAGAIFLKGDGQPLAKGELLRQPELAQTYRHIAEHGRDWFYRGAFAQSVGEWMTANGGILTAADFAGYQPKVRKPIRSTYRGYEIVTFPPPSSGGVHLLQMLNMLESFDLRAMGRNSPEFIHTTAETMKLAFADRAYWLGDPDFAKVPLGLISKDYAKKLVSEIDPKRSTAVSGPGQPDGATEEIFGKHTTHVSTADAEGNWVACTATVNTTFGSKVVVPGTGVVLNNEMDDFSVQPNVPNAFGLVGGEANAIAPGKRPLSSMTPTIVLKDGQPVFTVGAAGGPTIISQVLLAVVNTIDFRMDVKSALAEPRFHHQWRPDKLVIEKAVPTEVQEELARRGHVLSVVEHIGITQASGLDAKGELTAQREPRIERAQ